MSTVSIRRRAENGLNQEWRDVAAVEPAAVFGIGDRKSLAVGAADIGSLPAGVGRPDDPRCWRGYNGALTQINGFLAMAP